MLVAAALVVVAVWEAVVAVWEAVVAQVAAVAPVEVSAMAPPVLVVAIYFNAGGWTLPA